MRTRDGHAQVASRSSVMVRVYIPLNIKVYSLCVKYWHNARINSPNCILRSAMFSSQIHNSPWLESIEFILKINGMGNVWENLCSVSTLYLYKVIKQRLSDQYMQNWFTNNPFKRNGLERIKSKYECSTYFKYIIYDQLLRS